MWGIIVIAAFFGLAGASAIMGFYRAKRSRGTFVWKMRKSFGGFPDKKYTHDTFLHIPKYHERHRDETALDEITWNDLDMDEVFIRMNYCRSAAGEEVLYHLLRQPKQNYDWTKTEEQIDFFFHEEEARAQAQLLFEDMTQRSKFSVYDHLNMMDKDRDTSNAGHYFMLLVIAGCVVGCFFRFSAFFLLLVLALAFNLFSYFKQKSEVESYLATFNYVLRLIKGAEDLSAQLKKEMYRGVFSEEVAALDQDARAMQKFRRGSFLVTSSTSVGNASGNPLDILFDYLRIITHADLMKFNSMFSQLCAHEADVDHLITVTGTIEARLSIACFRASLHGAYCLPQFTKETTFSIADSYHPLVVEPVVNSITCDKNTLITGSNASGKSTFLKATAIAAIMAQTIHTVCAKSYAAPYYRVYSSMAITDDLTGGDSYYIVEIKSLKRILDASTHDGPRVLCFIDEALRGTNTLERIAASAQILKQFARRNVQCFAATHDGELTEILSGLYDNYHFDGEITDGDVRFDYRLREGAATTRNAIQLLRLMGYDETIVDDAEAMAQRFLSTGVWSAT